jgi:general stress protein 26
MANEEQTDKSNSELIERAWVVASRTHTAILIDIENRKPIARPMSAHVSADEQRIYFLTSAKSRKTRSDGEVATVFFTEGNAYVSMTGIARVTNDRAMIKELWSPFAKAWWSSADDPDIRVLEVTPSEAELWDGPNKIFAGALMLAAAISGNQPKVGDHAKLDL